MMRQAKESIQQAGQLLSEELLKQPAKEVWTHYLPQKISADTNIISYRAVARAISQNEYMKYGVEYEANRYKDRVRRAILGQSMTVDTLHLFAETFHFTDDFLKKVTDLVSSSARDQSQKSEATTRLHYEITSSFYDIFLDRNLAAYKLVCTLMIRSKQQELDGVWAPRSADITGIKLIEGGRSVYDYERNMYHFLFDYPLAESESAEICYLITVDRDVEQIGLFSLRFGMERETCFFRINFDNPATAPQELKFQRSSTVNHENPEVSESQIIKVHDGHASIYLNSVNHERIIFSLSE